MKVVIADDSALIRERLQNIINNCNQFELIGSYSNGLETLDAIFTQNPDLVISDNKMPGLSGMEVLKAVRKRNASLKFIMLTFYSSEYYRQLALEAGADYFYSKVDDFEKVELVINEMLKNKIES
jgi:DNA-binding NarL/FixJ family response regulator